MSALTDHSHPAQSDHSLSYHIRRTIVLALPVVLARLGFMAFVTVDVIVLGRAGPEPLAEYVLGGTVVDSLLATLIGLLMGVPVLAAQVLGAGAHASLGRIWRQGVVYAVVAGALLSVALVFGAAPLFRLLGQDPDLAARAATVTGILALNLPFMAIFVVGTTFLEALNRPIPGMLAVFTANLSNLALNIVLVFGWGPIPALGAPGCALATVINSVLLAIGMSLYIRYGLSDRVALGLSGTVNREPLWRGAGTLRGIGYAAGFAQALEAGSFTAVTLLVGLLGSLALAVHGMMFQFVALTFMVALGLATAAQVRVGNALGRGDSRGLALAGWVGLGLSAAVTGAAATVYVLWPETLLRVFTTDETVLAAAVPVMLWASLAMVCDGGQSVMNQACRGCGDTWVPTGLHVISYWAVFVPVAALLALPLGQGVAGVFQALTLASIISMGILMVRFAVLAKRPLPAPPR
ncbi:MATE family efflux transporter [Rhodospira trueperi]|uniref:Multidrug-efflux transporter n=1 Tax=Rhodospira trueperi TaxID=69960 RepID=A0A1G6XTW2_9PROT|nr:MATE family efflux transporter [Rhodospira trueperi]SDD80827.1 multidrug resistance protein, MATE family [Rhodospira trueperi]